MLHLLHSESIVNLTKNNNCNICKLFVMKFELSKEGQGLNRERAGMMHRVDVSEQEILV